VRRKLRGFATPHAVVSIRTVGDPFTSAVAQRPDRMNHTSSSGIGWRRFCDVAAAGGRWAAIRLLLDEDVRPRAYSVPKHSHTSWRCSGVSTALGMYLRIQATACSPVQPSARFLTAGGSPCRSRSLSGLAVWQKNRFTVRIGTLAVETRTLRTGGHSEWKQRRWELD
jgi:hypothetical protein